MLWVHSKELYTITPHSSSFCILSLSAKVFVVRSRSTGQRWRNPSWMASWDGCLISWTEMETARCFDSGARFPLRNCCASKVLELHRGGRDFIESFKQNSWTFLFFSLQDSWCGRLAWAVEWALLQVSMEELAEVFKGALSWSELEQVYARQGAAGSSQLKKL